MNSINSCNFCMDTTRTIVIKCSHLSCTNNLVKKLNFRERVDVCPKHHGIISTHHTIPLLCSICESDANRIITTNIIQNQTLFY